jgi:Fe2+ transport system protein B
MSKEEITTPNLQGKDLVHRIGNALPIELRAEYYSEMLYLENLQETDELLRIIRIMQYLTLLTEQVPSLILTEREKFEPLCREVISTAKRLEATGSDYYQRLHKQLSQLPDDIAIGISPKAIVERINDNLKKQFELSTIPVVAKELAANAVNIKASAREFTSASEELCGSWQSASDKAHRAIKEIESATTAAVITSEQAIKEINTAVTAAVAVSEQAAERFIQSFNKTYHWILGMVSFLLFFMGFFLGIMIYDRSIPRKQPNIEALPEPQQPVKPKPSNSNQRRRNQ